MKKILNDNLLGKIIKTFIEGFLASLIVAVPTIKNFSNLSFIKSVIIGAIAMGISSILNLLQSRLKEVNK